VLKESRGATGYIGSLRVAKNDAFSAMRNNFLEEIFEVMRRIAKNLRSQLAERIFILTQEFFYTWLYESETERGRRVTLREYLWRSIVLGRCPCGWAHRIP